MEGIMEEKSAEIAIVSADKLRQGLLVTFSDGTTTLFHPAFLYSVRAHQDNLQIKDEAEEPTDPPPEGR
jgi:hypothetical protein